MGGGGEGVEGWGGGSADLVGWWGAMVQRMWGFADGGGWFRDVRALGRPVRGFAEGHSEDVTAVGLFLLFLVFVLA